MHNYLYREEISIKSPKLMDFNIQQNQFGSESSYFVWNMNVYSKN